LTPRRDAAELPGIAAISGRALFGAGATDRLRRVTHLTASIAPLTPEERGFVAGAVLAGAGEAWLPRLPDPARARCAAAFAALTALTRDERAAALAVLISQAVMGVALAPLEALHPGWLAEALAEEPSDLIAALLGGLPPAARRAGVEVVRGRGEHPDRITPRPLGDGALSAIHCAVFAPLEALAVAPAGPLGARLAALGPDPLVDELAMWGARCLGESLAAAPVELRASAMAAVGAPWAAEIARASAAEVPPPRREQARWRASSSSPSLSDTVSALDRLRALGALALRDALDEEGAPSRRAIAGCLPPVWGRLLLD